MIIKSHIRSGYRSAAAYLKAQGENEKIRTVEISDPEAANLDEAFHNMWAVANASRVKKPLHHISINPFKDERLTDEQVLKIVKRCEEKYGYKPDDHQRVIVEHIKDGRQHFHVMWNRVSMETGKAVWPGLHWNKSKQAAREMEKELGLKRPVSRRMRRAQAFASRTGEAWRSSCRNVGVGKIKRARKTIAQSKKKPLSPVKPLPNTKVWPEAAVIDWKAWGHENPPLFFTKWPECVAPGFMLRGFFF